MKRIGIHIESSATVESSVLIGENSRIWHYSHIRANATIGSDCSIGKNVYIGSGVTVGNRCKIQNNSLLYEPATLGDGVFIGPGVILTNDHFPRAVNADSTPKANEDWNKVGVEVLPGASIGAGAICVAPLRIGEWAMVAAGAVVVNDVPPHALVAGVPARQIGWVGQDGFRLEPRGEIYVCPKSGQLYELRNGIMKEKVTE